MCSMRLNILGNFSRKLVWLVCIATGIEMSLKCPTYRKYLLHVHVCEHIHAFKNILFTKKKCLVDKKVYLT